MAGGACCRRCGMQRESGGLLFRESEEIKALFVLRGIGEWVQLCLLLSYKARLSGL